MVYEIFTCIFNCMLFLSLLFLTFLVPNNNHECLESKNNTCTNVVVKKGNSAHQHQYIALASPYSIYREVNAKGI